MPWGKDIERRGKGEWGKGQGNVEDGKKEMSGGCEKQKMLTSFTQDLQILLECLIIEFKKLMSDTCQETDKYLLTK